MAGNILNGISCPLDGADSKPLSSESEMTNVEELLYMVLLRWKPEWERKNIDLVGAFTANTFAQVDTEQVNQMLEWMLSYAIERTPWGGEVFTCLGADDDWIRICVADNSGELPKEVRKANMLSFSCSKEYQNIMTLQLAREKR